MRTLTLLLALSGIASAANLSSAPLNPIPPFLGYKDAPSAAQAVAASSTTQLVAIYNNVTVTVTGIRINVAVQSGNCQVGIYDNTGTLLASSTETTCPAPGAQTISFTASTTIQPGIYYLALGAGNTTATFGKSSGSGLIGCNNIALNLPMVNVTLPGSSTANCMALVGIVTGGITQ